MITLNKCDYCDILLKKMQVLLTDFENSLTNQSALTELMEETRVYYSIVTEFLYRFGMTGCKGCPYDNKECLKFLQQDYFETLSFFGQVPDESKMKCSVCQYLPKTVFGLLDKACGVKDEQELNRINLKFQFYNFIYIICEELINSCRRCDTFVSCVTILKEMNRYLDKHNIIELNQFVLAWKSSVNLDKLLAQHEKLKNLKRPPLSEVDLTGYTTYYLDFNIYDMYKKKPKLKDQLDKLSDQDNVRIVYSLTHMEEIPRMENEEYENKRLESIKKLTKGYAEFGDKNSMISFYRCDVDSFYDYAKHYENMNDNAEMEECFFAELGIQELLEQYQNKYSSNLGNISLHEILCNARKMKSGNEKYEPSLPTIEDMNYILGKVGVDGRTIEQYEDLFIKKDLTLHELRVAIISLSRLMHIIGLHGDKINNKDDKDAAYPVYGKKSYRTIRSSYYDIDHLTLASKCKYFVTCDKNLCKKAEDIYGLLGIKTKPVYVKKKEEEELPSELLPDDSVIPQNEQKLNT